MPEARLRWTGIDVEVWIILLRTEASYGTDILTLTVACTYLEQLFQHQKVIRYLVSME
jgi:hypothetical protein